MRLPAPALPSLAAAALLLAPRPVAAQDRSTEEVERPRIHPAVPNTPEECLPAVTTATRHMLTRAPFEAAQVFYGAGLVCRDIPEVWLGLALTDVVTRHPDLARMKLDSVATLPRSERWLALLRAALAAASGKLTDAERRYAALLAGDKDDRRLLVAHALTAAAAGRKDAARKDLIRLAELGYALRDDQFAVFPVEEYALELHDRVVARKQAPPAAAAAVRATLLADWASRLEVASGAAIRIQALEEVERSLGAEPAAPAVWLLKLDLLAALTGGAPGVCEEMGRAIDDRVEVARCLARRAWLARDLDTLCDAWGEVRRLRPQDGEGQIGAAACRFFREGRYPERPPGRSWPDVPAVPMTVVLYGRGLSVRGHGDQSYKWFSKQVKDYPGDLSILQELAAMDRAGERAEMELLNRHVATTARSDEEAALVRVTMARRARLLRAGERALATGDLAAAERLFSAGMEPVALDAAGIYGLLRVAVSRKDGGQARRLADLLLERAGQSNRGFFGGLLEEWRKAEAKLKAEQEAGEGKAEEAEEDPARGSLRKLLGVEGQQHAGKVGGPKPDMDKVPMGAEHALPGFARPGAQTGGAREAAGDFGFDFGGAVGGDSKQGYRGPRR